LFVCSCRNPSPVGVSVVDVFSAVHIPWVGQFGNGVGPMSLRLPPIFLDCGGEIGSCCMVGIWDVECLSVLFCSPRRFGTKDMAGISCFCHVCFYYAVYTLCGSCDMFVFPVL
jgi:hypothetical protein